jgi:Flp pilus assembly protein TadG
LKRKLYQHPELNGHEKLESYGQLNVSRDHKQESGVVLVEYAIAIPFLLFIAFGLLQLAMLFVADSVMQYAAFAAARSELVRGVNDHNNEALDVSPQRAAEMVTSLISYGEGEAEPILIPGWGTLAKSSYAQEHTTVTIEERDDDAFEAVVRFEYTLLFPMISWLSVEAMDLGSFENGALVLEKRHRMVRSFQ